MRVTWHVCNTMEITKIHIPNDHQASGPQNAKILIEVQQATCLHHQFQWHSIHQHTRTIQLTTSEVRTV